MEELFGIKGLTLGSLSGWLLVCFAAPATWWIRGMSDRRKADGVLLKVEDEVVSAQWLRFQDEIKRLMTRVEALEEKVKDLEVDLRDSNRERDDALSELARLKAYNLGRGQAAQEAAIIVAADRIEHKGATR